jgi:hypothetical protein
MAFENDIIPEADKVRIGRDTIKDPIGQPKDLNKWTIDRERGLFLIPSGGTGRYPATTRYFALGWKSEIIYFELSYKAESLPYQHEKLSWHLVSDGTPARLAFESSAVLGSLKDALQVWGMDFVLLDSFIIEFDF